MKRLFLPLMMVGAIASSEAQRDAFVLREDVVIPELPGFVALPEPDAELTAALRAIVEEVGLDQPAPAESSPEGREEWSSVYLVDLSDPENPRTAEWRGDNFVYPASTYKMYAMGEAIRQVVAGERSLDDTITVKPHNVRARTGPQAGDILTLSDIIRLTMQYSDNTTANELIDLVDRQRATALMHAMGCQGSEITRKYLSRDLEDEGYSNIVGTATSAQHLATFLWAMESGAIGGGKGRGLMRAYLAMNDKGRFVAGLPSTATIHSKTGWWNIYTSEAALIEDGPRRYILCALTVYPSAVADARLADLAAKVHEVLARQ